MCHIQVKVRHRGCEQESRIVFCPRAENHDATKRCREIIKSKPHPAVGCPDHEPKVVCQRAISHSPSPSLRGYRHSVAYDTRGSWDRDRRRYEYHDKFYHSYYSC